MLGGYKTRKWCKSAILRLCDSENLYGEFCNLKFARFGLFACFICCEVIKHANNANPQFRGCVIQKLHYESCNLPSIMLKSSIFQQGWHYVRIQSYRISFRYPILSLSFWRTKLPHWTNQICNFNLEWLYSQSRSSVPSSKYKISLQKKCATTRPK